MFTLYMYDVAIDPQTPSTLYVGTEAEGIFKSVNGGLSWNAVNDGLPDTIVYTLAIDPQTPSTLYAGTWDGLFKTTNGGESWSKINNGLAYGRVGAIAIDSQTPGTLYVGMYGVGGVFKSVNSGGEVGAK